MHEHCFYLVVGVMPYGYFISFDLPGDSPEEGVTNLPGSFFERLFALAGFGGDLNSFDKQW